MRLKVKFRNGKIHEIDGKGSLTWNLLAGRVKLVCGLEAKGIISTKLQWYLTSSKATCEHCMKKTDEPKPTDLSNYHTFVK